MATPLTPAAAEKGAACFNCIPYKMQPAVQTYLLTLIAKVTMTPAALIKAAACFTCIPAKLQPVVQTYLLNLIAGGGTGGGAGIVVGNYNGAAPSFTPSNAAGTGSLAVDSSNGMLWFYDTMWNATGLQIPTPV